MVFQAKHNSDEMVSLRVSKKYEFENKKIN